MKAMIIITILVYQVASWSCIMDQIIVNYFGHGWRSDYE